MKNILFIYGTRPELIKIFPVLSKMKNQNNFNPVLCFSGQHLEMVEDLHELFNLKPDIDLKIMTPNQSPSYITSKLSEKLAPVFEKGDYDLTIVQGDTTTSMVGALSSFYFNIGVAHIEAGLRSFNKSAPFPEEINRSIITKIAEYHFAPTFNAVKNLKKEGIEDSKIIETGNTVVDAIEFVKSKFLNLQRLEELEKKFTLNTKIEFDKPFILVTGHRRESHGEGILHICNALKEIAVAYPEYKIIYPVHLNPNVQKPVYGMLENIKNIHLIAPVNYLEMLFLISKSYFIITDSGGIQEEAPSFKKPVLVTREVTERTEAIDSKCAVLTGMDKNKIVHYTTKLIADRAFYQSMQADKNPFGDGFASQRIIDFLNGK